MSHVLAPRRARWCAVPLLLVALTALAGCGGAATRQTTDPQSTSSSPGSEQSRTAEPMRGVTLSVDSRVGPEPRMGSGRPPVTHLDGAKEGLLIRYRVSNRRTHPVVAVDRLPNGSATMSLSDRPDPLRVFIRTGAQGSLVFAKRIFDDGSAGLDYTAEFQGSVVAPGTTHSGRAFVSFPVSEFAHQSGLPHSARSWRFCLGVVPTTKGLPTDPKTHVVLVPNTSLDAEHAQHLLCSAPHRLPPGWDGS